MTGLVAANRAMQRLRAVQQGRGCDPPCTTWPTLHVGRVEEILPEPAGQPDLLHGVFDQRTEESCGAHNDLDRRLDPHTTILGCLELRAQEQVLEQSSDLIVLFLE